MQMNFWETLTQSSQFMKIHFCFCCYSRPVFHAGILIKVVHDKVTICCFIFLRRFWTPYYITKANVFPLFCTVMVVAKTSQNHSNTVNTLPSSFTLPLYMRAYIHIWKYILFAVTNQMLIGNAHLSEGNYRFPSEKAQIDHVGKVMFIVQPVYWLQKTIIYHYLHSTSSFYV